MAVQRRHYRTASNMFREIDRDIAQAEQEMEALSRLIEGLREAREALARAVVQPSVATPATQSAPTTGDHRTARGRYAHVSRIEAVATVLREAGEPLSANDIVERLAAGGRRDRREPVAAALSYLKQHGKAHPVERGQWELQEVA